MQRFPVLVLFKLWEKSRIVFKVCSALYFLNVYPSAGGRLQRCGKKSLRQMASAWPHRSASNTFWRAQVESLWVWTWTCYKKKITSIFIYDYLQDVGDHDSPQFPVSWYTFDPFLPFVLCLWHSFIQTHTRRYTLLPSAFLAFIMSCEP